MNAKRIFNHVASGIAVLAMTLMITAFVVNVIILFSNEAHAGSPFVQQQTIVVPQALVVTKYAVPVAVPQYSATVAPNSYVIFGAQQPTESTATINSLYAELKSLRAALEANGQIKPLYAPSLVTKNCAQCHGGEKPKGGLDLSTLDKLTPEARLKAIARMLTDDPKLQMPPPSSDVKIDDQLRGQLIQEFSSQSASQEKGSDP